MNLVLITLNYPFTDGEIFIEDELRVAQDYFKKIYIISLTSHSKGGILRYVPENAEVILARKEKIEIPILLKTFKLMLTKKIIKEYRFATQTLGFNSKKKDVLFKLFLYCYSYCVLKRVFMKNKINSKIFYSYWLETPSFFLSELKRQFSNIVCVSRTHGFDCFIDRGYQPFRREIINNLDAIYSVSEAGKHDIQKKLCPYVKNVKKDKIKHIHLGILRDDDIRNPIIDEKRNLCVLTCSFVSDIKRLDLLIDALNICDIPIKWIHIGDGILFDRIVQYAKCLDNKSNIEYQFLGKLNKEQIYEFYGNNHVDCFVNCSDSEGIPVSIMEAQSFGIPVIARNVGGNAEIVNNDNGFLITEECTPYILAKKLELFWDLEEKEVLKLRKNAFLNFKNNFSAEKNYKYFFEELCTLVKSC